MGGPHTGSVQFIFWAELRYLLLPAFRAFDCHSACRLQCKWDELLSSPPRSFGERARVCTLKRISIQVHLLVLRGAMFSYQLVHFLFLSVFFFFVGSLILPYRPSFFLDCTLDPARDARFNEPRRIISRGRKFSVLRAAASAKRSC